MVIVVMLVILAMLLVVMLVMLVMHGNCREQSCRHSDRYSDLHDGLSRAAPASSSMVIMPRFPGLAVKELKLRYHNDKPHYLPYKHVAVTGLIITNPFIIPAR